MAGALGETINMKWEPNKEDVAVSVVVNAFPNPPYSGNTKSKKTIEGIETTVTEYVPTCIPEDNPDFNHIFFASDGDASKKFKVTGSAADYLRTVSEVALEFVL